MGSMQGPSYWQNVSGGGFQSDGKTRTYYISADQVVWDYAPHGHQRDHRRAVRRRRRHLRAERPRPDRLEVREVPLPRVHRRDASRTSSRGPADERYLGLSGRSIRAEVGDTIKVVFRNNCPFPASVHPHGVFYNKDSEGAPYDDGTTAPTRPTTRCRPAARTPTPGGARARRPRPEDGSSVMWMYHSHTDEMCDTYAGLIGPMITRAAWRARRQPEGRRPRGLRAVHGDRREPEPLPRARTCDRFAQPRTRSNGDDEDFARVNQMHSINGYVYGNLPLLTMKKGERVRWYVMGMGTEVDLHTPHWHGNNVTVAGCGRTSSPAPGADARGRHGSRQRRYLAVPLPRQRPHPRRDDRPLQGAGVGHAGEAGGSRRGATGDSSPRDWWAAAANRRIAASSVAPIFHQYRRSLRPCATRFSPPRTSRELGRTRVRPSDGAEPPRVMRISSTAGRAAGLLVSAAIVLAAATACGGSGGSGSSGVTVTTTVTETATATGGSTGGTGSAAPCAASDLLPVLKAEMDGSAEKYTIVKVKVVRCQNDYAFVIAVPDRTVCQEGVATATTRPRCSCRGTGRSGTSSTPAPTSGAHRSRSTIRRSWRARRWAIRS